jgi:hypothetical protein
VFDVCVCGWVYLLFLLVLRVVHWMSMLYVCPLPIEGSCTDVR